MKLPTRRQLSGVILDKTYDDLKAQIESQMSGCTACLSSDGWSNVLREPVIAYMASVAGNAFFLESVSTGSTRHTAEWLAKDTVRVIEAHPEVHFAGAVTDNAGANRAAWRLLEEKYPHKFFYGNFVILYILCSI
jgi:hypothetical protein